MAAALTVPPFSFVPIARKSSLPNQVGDTEHLAWTVTVRHRLCCMLMPQFALL